MWSAVTAGVLGLVSLGGRKALAARTTRTLTTSFGWSIERAQRVGERLYAAGGLIALITAVLIMVSLKR
ncbi:MAG: hypothetical protein QOJ29_2425 [Thermoleophilaceae bacterium]|nr:hypothetical protein [Thermoleophilaceae bacterium]